jgi:peptidoglycan/LPS O-acetylase OafA/YrhL
MTATSTLTAPPTTREAGTTKQLWRTGVVAGLAAGVATSTFAAIAHGADVSLKVSGEQIPVVGFAQLTFVGAIIGTILAVVLSHRANRPQHTFVITTIALTLASVVPDALADAHTATKIVLALTHVLAAAIVIPAIASRLSD